MTQSYQVYPNKELEAFWKQWVYGVRKTYNLAIAYLNSHQGYEKVGKAGGKQGFRTAFKALGLVPDWIRQLKISHATDNALMEAYSAWSKTKKVKGKRRARFRSVRDNTLTIQFDRGDFNKGHWMPSQTKNIPHATFKGHGVSVPICKAATELTYAKGRWFGNFPFEFEPEVSEADGVIALDPGVRTFLTGFDGNVFSEFGAGDINRIARLCLHYDKLQSEKALSKGKNLKHYRYRLNQAMRRLRVKIKNVRDDLHKKVASYLAKTYKIIFLPTFETSQMVVKKSRKIRSKTARNMLSWAHYQFAQTLKHLCFRYGSRLVRSSESFTSKTCTKCGHIHQTLGGSKWFKCPKCGHQLDRDHNGAFGYLLKAMWDTTWVEVFDDNLVILSA
jgi:putative transposase